MEFNEVSHYPPEDRKGWTSGPWDSEADKYVWIDEATDLDCMIRRGPMGALCGYVGVPPGHRLHGADFMDCELEVHGGLTFGAACDVEHGICHVPLPGRPEHVYWLGFDCGHSFDRMPAFDARERELGFELPPPPSYYGRDATYRTLDYVIAEVENLARQIAAV